MSIVGWVDAINADSHIAATTSECNLGQGMGLQTCVTPPIEKWRALQDSSTLAPSEGEGRVS